MGMFDSLIDAEGGEWQTKAYDRLLDEYAIGDRITAERDANYQVEVLGGGRPITRSFATVRGGVLAAVPAERDPNLPLLDYGGHLHEGDEADAEALSWLGRRS